MASNSGGWAARWFDKYHSPGIADVETGGSVAAEELGATAIS